MKIKASTAGELIAFSLPLIMSGVLQQLYSWADAFIVGHAEGSLPLAAVGATATVSNFLINTLTGFNLGLSIMGAQRFGRRDESGVRRIVACFGPGLVGVYMLLAALARAFARPILQGMDTPPEIFDYSLSYLKVMFAGVPFLACYNLIAAMLRAVGNTKAAFYAVLLSSLLNVALDMAFIVGFGWGVAGAAWATVISQAAMTVFMTVYTWRKYPWMLPRRGEKTFDKGELAQGLRFSLPPMLQNSVTALGNLVLQNFMNGFGFTTVLAITTAYRVDCIMLLPIINLGAAVSSMTARAKGAENGEKVKRCLTSGLWLMTVVTVALSAVMFLFGARFVAIFGVEGEALAIGRQFFRDLSVFYLLFGLGVVLRSSLEGVGDITFASLVGVGMLGARILLSYVLRPVLAGRTIAIAEGIAWLLGLAVLAWRMACRRKAAQQPSS